MVHRCETCDRDFNTEESLSQHNSSRHPIEKKGKVNTRKYFVLMTIVLIIVFSSLSVYSYMKKPGSFDEFAQCLTDKGAIVYGNDFCQYTVQQLNFFGKSKEYLNYVKCADNKKLCDEKGISITPTWEINGEMYKQVHDFEKLSLLSGCEV